MNLLYVDLNIVHHPDSAILIFPHCHWHLSYWYHPDSAVLVFHRCHWCLPYWVSSVSSSWCSLVKLIFPSSFVLSYFFSSVFSLSFLWEVTLEKRRTGLAGNFFGWQLLLNFFRHGGICILDFLIFCWLLDLIEYYLRFLVCRWLSLHLLSGILVGNFLVVVSAQCLEIDVLL